MEKKFRNKEKITPMFSIIMPVYNNEIYFPLAVKSILEQNYRDFELIIVDDGSTDKTPELADHMASQDKRIRVVHQKNQWIYASFNNGIHMARGEYVYIVNSDDKLIPGALMLMAKKIKEYQPDVIWTKVVLYHYDHNPGTTEQSENRQRKKTEREVYCKNKQEVRQIWPFLISSALTDNQANLYRRELMQNQPFRNDIYGADAIFNLDIADRINTALVLPEPVYAYYIYPNPEMNASVGKYYPYEHKMFNEFYVRYKSLFQKWGLPLENYREILCKKRMSGLSIEFRNLQAFNCPLSTEEKLQFAFCGCIDEVVKECVSESGRQEELESRILCAVKQLLIKEPIGKSSKMYFAYELLEALLRYEKDEDEFQKMENAIYHPLNPLHIGNVFYQKLVRGRNK